MNLRELSASATFALGVKPGKRAMKFGDVALAFTGRPRRQEHSRDRPLRGWFARTVPVKLDPSNVTDICHRFLKPAGAIA